MSILNPLFSLLNSIVSFALQRHHEQGTVSMYIIPWNPGYRNAMWAQALLHTSTPILVHSRPIWYRNEITRCYEKVAHLLLLMH